MNAIIQTHPNLNIKHRTEGKHVLWVVPLGRFFFSLIFIMAGLNHFSSGSIAYATAQGVPLASIIVPISGIIAFLGGASVLLGYHAKIGGLLLLIFLVPVTLLMHNFWAVSDPGMAQMQMAHFMKNLALIGGAILFSFYGAGPLSLDHKMAKDHVR